METLIIETRSRTHLVDISGQVQDAVTKSGVQEGLCVVYVPHTTAGVTINENADPSVRTDIEEALDKVVPWRAGYKHSEGNSAAHVKASMMGFSVQIPISGGKLAFGTWQGIYFCEFDGPRTRQCHVTVTAAGG